MQTQTWDCFVVIKIKHLHDSAKWFIWLQGLSFGNMELEKCSGNNLLYLLLSLSDTVFIWEEKQITTKWKLLSFGIVSGCISKVAGLWQRTEKMTSLTGRNLFTTKMAFLKRTGRDNRTADGGHHQCH